MSSFDSYHRIWFLTWTTYGTWLPGDDRGYVSPKFDAKQPEPRNNKPGKVYDSHRPELSKFVQIKMLGPPILLSTEQAEIVRKQFEETSQIRNWQLMIGAIMCNHIHLLVCVPNDPDPAVLMRDYKSYASRALNRAYPKPASGTWWTEQGSKRKVTDQRHFNNVVKYINSQAGALSVWGILKSGS